MTDKVTRIVLDTSGVVAGAKAAKAATDEMGGSLDKLAEKVATVSVRQIEASRQLQGSGASFERLRRTLDPTIKSQEQLAKAIGIADRALADGKTTVQEHARIVELARSRYTGLTQSQIIAAKVSGDLTAQLRGMASQVPVLGGALASMNVATLAAAAAGVLLGKVLIDSVAKAAEAEKAQLRLEAVLKATGNTAGLTGKQLADFADEMEGLTLTTEEAVKQAAGVLATFDAVSGDTFKRVIRDAQDYAAVFGGDVVAATEKFGKALEDPIRGMDLLRRSGIQLTAAQRDLIRTFVETGERAKAQEIILGALEARVGGAGQAEAGGLSGATHRLGKAWDDLQKNFGSGISPLVVDSLNGIAAALNLIATGAGKVDKILREFKQGLKDSTIGQVADELSNSALAQLGRKLADELNQSTLANLVRSGRSANSNDGPIVGDNNTNLKPLEDFVASFDATGEAQKFRALKESSDALVKSLDGVGEARRALVNQQMQLDKAIIDTTAGIEAGTISFEGGTKAIEAYTKALGILGIKLRETRDPLEQFRKNQGEALELSGLYGSALAQKQAEISGRNAAAAAGREYTDADKAQDRKTAAQIFGNQQGVATSRELQQLDLQAAGLLKVADAYKISTTAADKAQLRLQAEIAKRDEGRGAIEAYYQGLLKVYEAEKALDGTKLLVDLDRQIEQQKQLNAALAASPAQYAKVTAAIETAKKVDEGYFKAGSKQAEEYRQKLVDLHAEQAQASLIAANKSLQDQNELIQAEINLLGQPPQLIAREITLIKARQYAIANGLPLDDKRIDQYQQLLEQQELLNQKLTLGQQEQQRWLEPFRQGLDSLQGVFENLVSGGIKSFKDFGKQVFNIFKQLAAQIATLLVFRPVINSVLNYAGLGGYAQQLGYGNAGGNGGYVYGGGAAGSLGGYVPQSGLGGLLGNLGFNSPVAGTNNIGAGGLGSLLGGNGGLGGILNLPIGSAFSSLFGGASAASTATSGILGAVGGSTGGLTLGGTLGAIGGGISGILSILKGGTANTISGITSIIGAGVSLIPGVGQILGPLISIAGPLLGGLFKKKPKKGKLQLLTEALPGIDTDFQHDYDTVVTPFGRLGYNAPGTNASGGSEKFQADFIKAVGEIDKGIAGLLTAAQIATVSHALQTTPTLQTKFKKFDNEGFDMVEDRLKTELRALYGSNVADKALSGISRSNDNIDELANRAGEVIQFANALDQLGVKTTDAEAAVKAINQQFDDMKAKATEFGFGADTLAKIATNRQASIDQLAKDFNAQTARNALAITDPNQLAMNDLLADQETRRKNALYLNTVSTVLIDINALEAEFGLERQHLVEQQLGNLKQSFRDFFDQLLLGPQSALSPQKQLEQALGRYHDITGALTASNDNDPVAKAAFQQAATNALALMRQVNASSLETAALFDEIVAITRRLGNIPGFATGTANTSGLFLAGERGPELVYSASNVGVLNAAQTRGLFAGGGLTAADMRAIMNDHASMILRGLAASFRESNADVAERIGQLADAMQSENPRARVKRSSDRAGRRSAA